MAWVCRQLQLPADQIQLGEYTHNRTLYRHRATILAQLGYAAFGDEHRQALEQEANRLTHLQTRPALMLDALVAYLRERRVEIPPYNTLREVITLALDAFDTHLQTMIEQYLTTSDRATLDALLNNTTGTGSLSATGRYPLTELKHISQSMRPSVIAGRVDLFNQLKQLFVPLAPLIARLYLADDTIQYYAQYVIDNRSVHLAGRVHERYLRLLAFIIHQYLCVGDALILTLQKAVVLVLNDCEENSRSSTIRAAR